MKEERLLPVGTKVYSILESEWGVVQEHKTGKYPILVKFEGGNEVYYTKEGKVLAGFENPNLSLTEYTLETGGFTPISEYWNKPQIGGWGYFWDRETSNAALFGRLTGIENRGFEEGNTAYWRCFSHEIPDHIKKQMEQ